MFLRPLSGILIALLVALMPSGRSAAEPPSPAPDGCKKLDDAFRRTELPARAQIEILVAAGKLIPHGWRDTYEEMALEIVRCAGDHAHVELFPITDAGATLSALFTGAVPGPEPNDTNQFRINADRERFVGLASARVRQVVSSGRDYVGFDPVGTLYAAGDSLRQAQGASKLVVIVIGNGWQQTKLVNLFRYNDNPAVHAAEVVRQLRDSGSMPRLNGADVVFAGVTPGDRHLKMGSIEIRGLCKFWEDVIRAGGGTLQGCKSALPGIAAPF
ncbi:MAG: hypothetical protein JWM87_1462 [Candidatus Eremiobacteraeota bacterium]|nr:hypothetical protein [Candidatus Eremiobacteraeota bacterium]